MKILVLDSYDSFTFNLVYLIRQGEHNCNLDVRRNDKIPLEDVEQYDKILLSPGPGLPDSAGILKQVIENYGRHKSILGICLGHQGIAEVYGAKLFNMPEVKHGIPSTIHVRDENDPLFTGIDRSFEACRYHSWSVLPESINGSLKVTAVDDDGEIMGLSSTEFDVRGLQFHPESILTKAGARIINNWISI